MCIQDKAQLVKRDPCLWLHSLLCDCNVKCCAVTVVDRMFIHPFQIKLLIIMFVLMRI